MYDMTKLIVLIHTTSGMCRYVYITYVGYDMCINSSTLAVIGVGSGEFPQKIWVILTLNYIP